MQEPTEAREQIEIMDWIVYVLIGWFVGAVIGVSIMFLAIAFIST